MALFLSSAKSRRSSSASTFFGWKIVLMEPTQVRTAVVYGGCGASVDSACIRSSLRIPICV